MKDSLFFEGKEYISAKRGANEIGYASDYIGQLCRAKKLPSRLVGRTWYVERESLIEHKQNNHAGKIKNQINYESENVPRLPELTGKILPKKHFFSVTIAKESLAISLGLLVAVSAGLATLGETNPKTLGQVESLSAKVEEQVSASVLNALSEVVETIVAGFHNLKDFALKRVFLASEKVPKIKSLPKTPSAFGTFPLAGEGKTETRPPLALTTPGPTPITIDSLRTDLRRELENYVRAQIGTALAPQQIVYNAAPTYNTTVLRESILLADTRPTVTRQSSSDIEHGSSVLTRLTEGGTFSSANLTNSTISGPQGSFTEFSFGSATGTSATTTSFFSTTASSTNIFFSTGNGGNFTSTGLGTFANLLSNGSSTLQNFTFLNATGTSATTTSFFSTTASSTNLFSASANIGTLTTTATTTITGAFAGITFSGTGNHDITATGGTLRIGSNTIIGNIEALDDTVDIGTAGVRFDKIYANEVNASTLVGTLTGGNLTAETFSINSDNATADTEDANLAFERGTASPNALMTWNSARNEFQFNSGMRITNTIGATTTLILDSGSLGIATSTPYAQFSVVSNGTSGTVIAADAISGFSGTLLDLKVASSTKFSINQNGDFTASGNSTSTSATTTNFFSTTASSTNLFSAAANLGTLTLQALTSTRVPFAGAGGLFSDDSDLTFSTDTLSATKLLSSTSVSTPSLISTGAITATPTAGNNFNIVLSTTGDFAVNTNQLYVDTSTGFVGIGTVSPIQALHVVGQCVTGDTLLKRRRRRKKKDGTEEDYFEDTRIDEIKAGDEILTLDENTGRLVVSRVNALMDMGIKEIFKLTTATGKTIRTTGNHPYLVLPKHLAKDTAVTNGHSRVFAFIDASNIYYGTKSAGFKMDFAKLKSYLVSRFSVSKILYFGAINENKVEDVKLRQELASLGYELMLITLKKFKDGRKKADIDSRMTFELMRMKDEYDKAVVLTGDGDFFWVLDYLKKVKEKIWLLAMADRTAKDLTKLFGPNFIHLGNVQKTIEKTVKNETDATFASVSGTSQVYQTTIPFVKGGLWTKVSEIKEGHMIATAGANGKPIFERITSIEQTSAEQVYDIEVEGTHNFVGNDIIAHNTFISNDLSVSGGDINLGTGSATTTLTSASGNLGIATTSPYAKLSVVGGTSGTVIGVDTISGYSGNILELKVASTTKFSINQNGDFTASGNSTSTSATTTNFFSTTASSTNLFSSLLTVGGTGLVVDSARNVGIGSTTPFAVLGVENIGSGLSFAVNDVANDASPFVIDASGNVGIGTTGPKGKLTVYGGPLVIDNDITEKSWRFLQSNAVANDLSIQQAATAGGIDYVNRVTIDPSGNVGIGTTGPGARLEVFGADLAIAEKIQWKYDAGVTWGSSPTDGGKILDLYNQVTTQGSTQGRITFNTDNGEQAAIGSFAVDNADPRGRLFFATSDATSLKHRMVIDENGNVGIGTTSPGFSLEVEGSAATTVIQVENTASDGDARLFLASSHATGGNPYINFNSRNQTGGSSFSIGQLKGSDDLYFVSSNDLDDTADQRMVILGDGNVGIGSTTPFAVLGVENIGSGLSFAVNDVANDASPFVIDASGNVGIGTTGPTNKLEVVTTSAGAETLPLALSNKSNTNASAVGMVFSAHATGAVTAKITNIINGSLYPLAFYTYGSSGLTEQMRIQDGNVGIGTTGPGALLDVRGSAIFNEDGADADFRIESDTNANHFVSDAGAYGGPGLFSFGGSETGTPFAISSPAITISANDNFYKVRIGSAASVTNPAGSTAAIIASLRIDEPNITNSGTAVSDAYSLYINAAPTEGTRNGALWVDDGVSRFDGNVGIGTTGPASENTSGILTQVNSATSYSSFSLSTQRTDGAAQNLGIITFDNLTNDATYKVSASINGQSGASGTANKRGGQLLFQTTPDNTAGGLATRMTIDQNGNVGIGTTGPLSGLHVAAGTFGAANTSGSAADSLFRINKPTQSDSGLDIGIDDSTSPVRAWIQSRDMTNYATNNPLLLNPNGGNVGIGTTSPSAILSVKGAGTGTGRAFALSDSSNVERVTILDNGNVGIGTTGPGYLLDVYKSANGAPNLARFYNDNAGTGAESTVFIGNSATETDSVYLQALGTGFTTASTLVQDGAVLASNTGLSGGLSIIARANAPIRFATNGHTNERMRITEGGNVGIGTTSPSAILSVKGAGTGTGRAFALSDSSNVERVTILDNGNVGIGTTGPGAPLEISTAGGGGLRVTDTNPTPDQYAEFKIDQTGANYGLGLFFQGTQQATFYDTGLALGSYIGSDPPTGGAIISGNVGIGTTSPSAILSVKGAGTGTGRAFALSDSSNVERVTILDNGNVGIGTTDPSGKLHLLNSTGSTALRVQTNDTTAVAVFTHFSTDTDGTPRQGYVGLDYNSNTIFLNRGGNDQSDGLSINSSGNVGIGTTAPGKTLDVSGTFALSGVATFGSTSGGQVFGTANAGTNSWYASFTNTGGTSSIGQEGSSGGSNITGDVGYDATWRGPSGISLSGNDGASVSMRINSLGNVGIGTTSPSAILSVKGAGTGTGRAFALSDSSNVERVTILDNGNVGIGTTGPRKKVHFQWASGSTGAFSLTTNDWVEGSVGSLLEIQHGAASGNTYSELRAISNGGAAWNNLVLQSGGGNVGIGTTSPATLLEVGGSTANVTFDGYKSCTGFTSNGNGLLACTASDERLKQDILSLDNSNGLSAINALNPVSFYWNPGTERGTKQQFGLIAQQVQDVFPNLVVTSSPTALTPEGTLSVNYEGLISPIILAIQELYAEFLALKEQVLAFADKIVSKEIVVTNQICIGNTCVNESQLQAMLANTGTVTITETIQQTTNDQQPTATEESADLSQPSPSQGEGWGEVSESQAEEAPAPSEVEGESDPAAEESVPAPETTAEPVAETTAEPAPEPVAESEPAPAPEG